MSQTSSARVRSFAHKVTLTIVSPYKHSIMDVIHELSNSEEVQVIGEIHSVITKDEYSSLTGMHVMSKSKGE